MKGRLFGLVLLAGVLGMSLGACKPAENEKEKKAVTLTVKTTPIGLGKVPDKGDVEVYDLFVEASEKFRAQYEKYDVEFEISRYNYLDEKEQLADKYGTDEAVDIYYSGSYNTPSYAAKGWLAPLDDIIDEELRKDIEEIIWEQNSIDGKVYILPFQQLENILMVNAAMMRDAGLEEYIPEQDTIAHWTTEDFTVIFQALSDYFKDENKFAFMMYAENNQGDSHIMTLLRSFGGTLYDSEGRFNVNTPEGVRALEWIKEINDKGFTPKGAENMELLDCMNLFNNGQLAVCVGNLTNFWDAWNRGLEVFGVNFPSLDGDGYATSGINGFCVFDNGDEDKVQAAKDFIRFIYTDKELMKYTLGTQPVNRSVIDEYKDDIRMLEEYGDNARFIVDNIRNNLNWQGVRDVFYLNIRDLLLGKKTPEEVAAAIDKTCNEALEKGESDLKNQGEISGD